MIKTFIISLKDEQKRRQNVLAQCLAQGIEAECIDAVDMRQASQADIERLSSKPWFKKPKKQRWLNKGELGCALSHHAVYQKIIDANLPYAFILEDDARFIRNPQALLSETTLNQLQQHYPFDVLILGYVKTLESQLPYYYRRLPIKTIDETIINGETLRFGTPWEQYGCGTLAYIVSQEGAKKLIEANTPICVPADDWLIFEQRNHVRVLHCRPTFVLEDLENLPSTIRFEGKNDFKIAFSSWLIRSIKGYLKHIAMNYLGMK